MSRKDAHLLRQIELYVRGRGTFTRETRVTYGISPSQENEPHNHPFEKKKFHLEVGDNNLFVIEETKEYALTPLGKGGLQNRVVEIKVYAGHLSNTEARYNESILFRTPDREESTVPIPLRWEPEYDNLPSAVRRARHHLLEKVVEKLEHTYHQPFGRRA